MLKQETSTNRKVWGLFTAVSVAVLAWGAYLAHGEAILAKLELGPRFSPSLL